jgi:Copine
MELGEIKGGKATFEVHDKKRCGEVKLVDLKFDRRFSFLDYVFGGCEISLGIAIDFTLSNGDPKDPKSLHYFDKNKNEYISAINSVGSILQYYDHDKSIPAFGFGAVIPPI